MHTQSHKSPKSIVLEGASPQIQLGVYRIHTYTLILLQATKDSIRAFRGGTGGKLCMLCVIHNQLQHILIADRTVSSGY